MLSFIIYRLTRYNIRATITPIGTLMYNHSRAVGTAMMTPIINSTAINIPPKPAPAGIRLMFGPHDRGSSLRCT